MSKEIKNEVFKDANDMLLAILACGEENTVYSIGKIQKMTFLIDREAGVQVGGPFFKFEPQILGPYDEELDAKLSELVRDRYIVPALNSQFQSYKVSHKGFEFGKKLLKDINPVIVKYMENVIMWGLSHNFMEIVHSILNKYPDLKRQSAFG